MLGYLWLAGAALFVMGFLGAWADGRRTEAVADLLLAPTAALMGLNRLMGDPDTLMVALRVSYAPAVIGFYLHLRRVLSARRRGGR